MVESLAKKVPRSHKTMLIYQGLNLETGDLETFVEHCEQEETTDSISGEKFSASDEDSDTKRKKNRPNFKEQEEHGKKRHKNNLRFIALSMVKKIHTTRDCKVLKAKTKDKPKYPTKDYKRNYREVNLLEKEATHQRAKCLKYNNINKSLAEKKTCVILDDTLDSDSSSISEAHNYRDEDKKISIAYDSYSGNDDESSNISIDIKK